MKRYGFKLFLLLTAVSLSFPSFAQSQSGAGQSYYGGIDVFGTKSEQVSDSDISRRTQDLLGDDAPDQLQGGRALTFDDAGRGKRIYMGVSSADDWDWEWGYIDFGKHSGQYDGQTSADDVFMRTDIKSEGWFLHVQFSPQIAKDLEANIKLGILRWDGERFERLVKNDDPNDAITSFDTIAGIDEYYGAGLIYSVNERWKIRLDANRYMLKDDKLDTIGLAAQFWFTGRLINNIFDY